MLKHGDLITLGNGLWMVYQDLRDGELKSMCLIGKGGTTQLNGELIPISADMPYCKVICNITELYTKSKE